MGKTLWLFDQYIREKLDISVIFLINDDIITIAKIFFLTFPCPISNFPISFVSIHIFNFQRFTFDLTVPEKISEKKEERKFITRYRQYISCTRFVFRRSPIFIDCSQRYKSLVNFAANKSQR